MLLSAFHVMVCVPCYCLHSMLWSVFHVTVYDPCYCMHSMLWSMLCSSCGLHSMIGLYSMCLSSMSLSTFYY